MAHGERALHQVEVEIDHTGQRGEIAADQRLLGRTIHLGDGKAGGLHRRAVVLSHRLHIDSRQGLFHGGQRRQGVPHGQGAPHQVEIELHHAGHAAQLAPDQRFFRGAVHVLDVIDGNRHPGSGAGLCF